MSPDGELPAPQAAVAPRPTIAYPALCEAVGTAMLLIAVVGSGIMAERLSGGNAAIALLANAIATGAALFPLLLVFGPQSGAHLNPVVSVAAAWRGEAPWLLVGAYLPAQVGGAVAGVWLAHLMVELPLLQTSQHVRTGTGQWIAETVATFGLLLTIWGARRHGIPATAGAVAAYITGAYWFTASTSFANPAVTVARALSDTFAGIAPASVPDFILAQVAGLAIALPLLARLERNA